MIRDLWAGPRYTTDELNSRLKFFIGIILGLTLFGIVFVVLYSLIFVTQPTNKISPVDSKFFELIIPIATFLTGTLSGIMLAGDDKDLKAKALDAANKPYVPPPPPPPEPAVSVAPASTMAPPKPPVAPVDPNFVPQVASGFGGKPAPTQPPFPEI